MEEALSVENAKNIAKKAIRPVRDVLSTELDEREHEEFGALSEFEGFQKYLVWRRWVLIVLVPLVFTDLIWRIVNTKKDFDEIHGKGDDEDMPNMEDTSMAKYEEFQDVTTVLLIAAYFDGASDYVIQPMEAEPRVDELVLSSSIHLRLRSICSPSPQTVYAGFTKTGR